MKTWTSEETEILVANYNIVTNDRLSELLPNKTPLSIYKKAYKMGFRKTAEIEFLNRSEARKGEKAPNWNGGIKTTKAGYRVVLCPEHPRADRYGYVMEHILVWEKATGVLIPMNCCIHHLNGNKADNRIQNLCMMQHAAHTVFHHTGTKRSGETKARISARAKARFADEKNHPSYKEIDTRKVQMLIDQGSTVKDACKAFGISKTTFYSKRRKQNGT